MGSGPLEEGCQIQDTVPTNNSQTQEILISEQSPGSVHRLYTTALASLSIFMKSQSSCTILLQPYCPSFLPSYMVSSSISDGCFLCVCSAFTSLYNCSCFSFRFHMKNFLREFFADHSNLILSVPHFLGGSFFTVLVTI